MLSLIFGRSESSTLYSCDDDIFNNDLKSGNWMCKLDNNYDRTTVPERERRYRRTNTRSMGSLGDSPFWGEETPRTVGSAVAAWHRA